MTIIRIGAAAALALASSLFVPQAFSHITLEAKEAPLESRYKAVLRVPHGCEGSPTIALRVRIPEGVIDAKPQPKAGWALAATRGDYAHSYTLYGAELNAGVKEIEWSGGSLPDGHYDEFAFVGYLSDTLEPGSTLYFPVVQVCEEGEARWTGTSDGHHHHSSGHGHSESPAPGLKLLPKQ